MKNTLKKITNDLSEIKNLIVNLNNQPTKQKPEEDLTDHQGAAKILKKSVGTVYNLVSKNKVPHFKRGGKLYFSKKALLNYIYKGKVLTENELKNKNSTNYTQSERLKKFTSTIDIDNLTTEEAAAEALNIDYHVNQHSIKDEK
jgi:predicted alpha/beta-fold hydrolase